MISPPAAKAKIWTPAHAIPFILSLGITFTAGICTVPHARAGEEDEPASVNLMKLRVWQTT